MTVRNTATTLLAVVALAGCASTSAGSTTPASACVTNAPGTLCGDDAKSYCQEMKTGQQVDPRSVGATTRRQCAALGVRGLR